MVTSLEHAAVFVRDLEKVLGFYRDLLGGEVVRTAHIPASDTAISYVQIGEGVLEFLSRKDAPKYGMEHLAFMVDDLDATWESMSADGIEFSVKPKTAGSGVGRIAFLSDPDGIRLELLAQPKFNRPLSELRMNAHLQDTDHFSIRVSNLERSRAFYEKYFGAVMVKEFRIPEKKMDIRYFACGKNILELIAVDDSEPFEGNRIGHVALRVDNVDRTVEEFSKKGVPVAVEPRDASIGLGRVAVFLDPEDNRIEVLDRGDLRDL